MRTNAKSLERKVERSGCAGIYSCVCVERGRRRQARGGGDVLAVIDVEALFFFLLLFSLFHYFLAWFDLVCQASVRLSVMNGARTREAFFLSRFTRLQALYCMRLCSTQLGAGTIRLHGSGASHSDPMTASTDLEQSKGKRGPSRRANGGAVLSLSMQL